MTAPADAPVHLDDAVLSDAAAIRTLPGLGDSTRRLIDQDLTRADRCVLVARGPGAEVIGMAMGMVQLDEAHVLDIAVAPGWRRRGIGRRLLVELLRRLRSRGASAVTLEVRRSNEVAQALYRDLGFVVEGARPRYYPDGEDALLLWRRDARPADRDPQAGEARVDATRKEG